MAGIKDIPQSLIDSVMGVIQEVRVKDLERGEKKQYDALKSKIKRDESAVIDLRSGKVEIIKSKDFDKSNQTKIVEDHIPQEPKEKIFYDKDAKKPDPEIKKEESEDVPGEADDIVKSELEKLGKDLDDLSSDEKKALFNKVDKEIKAKDEATSIQISRGEDPKISHNFPKSGDIIVNGNRVSLKSGDKIVIDHMSGPIKAKVIGVEPAKGQSTGRLKVISAKGKSAIVLFADGIKKIMKEEIDVDELEQDDQEQLAIKRSHGGDPQLGEAFHSSSPEPNSAVGQHIQAEYPKHVDVVDEMTHIGGVKREGYRLMLQYPSGRSVFFPSMGEDPAPTLEVLNTLSQSLPEEYQLICTSAILAATHRPHMKSQFSGPKQKLGESILGALRSTLHSAKSQRDLKELLVDVDSALSSAHNSEQKDLLDLKKEIKSKLDLKEDVEFDKVVKKIAKLTDENQHTQARIELAKLLGPEGEKIKKQLEDIDKQHQRAGSLTNSLSNKRDKLERDLFALSNRYFNPQQHKKLRQAF